MLVKEIYPEKSIKDEYIQKMVEKIKSLKIGDPASEDSFEQPFGGWRYSGIDNEEIMITLKEMSRTKTVILKNITK